MASLGWGILGPTDCVLESDGSECHRGMSGKGLGRKLVLDGESYM